MRFVTVRDLRTSPAAIWKQLPEEQEMIITNNGKPIALLTPLTDTDLEGTLKAVRRARAQQAVAALQEEASKSGRSSMNLQNKRRNRSCAPGHLMRVVVDTKVLVSALLSPGGNPAQILGLILADKVTPLVAPSILAEYRLVLKRPKFAFSPFQVAALLDFLESEGEFINSAPLAIPFRHEADREFYEVAVSGHADALITGNSVHFPSEPVIMTPAQFLAFWSKAAT